MLLLILLLFPLLENILSYVNFYHQDPISISRGKIDKWAANFFAWRDLSRVGEKVGWWYFHTCLYVFLSSLDFWCIVTFVIGQIIMPEIKLSSFGISVDLSLCSYYYPISLGKEDKRVKIFLLSFIVVGIHKDIAKICNWVLRKEGYFIGLMISVI